MLIAKINHSEGIHHIAASGSLTEIVADLTYVTAQIGSRLGKEELNMLKEWLKELAQRPDDDPIWKGERATGTGSIDQCTVLDTSTPIGKAVAKESQKDLWRKNK